MTATKDKNMTQPSDTDKPEMILVERREQVGLITLNRPKQLNALNRQLANETLAAPVSYTHLTLPTIYSV